MVLIDVLEGGSVLSELLGDFWVGIFPFHAQPGSAEGTDVALSASEGWGSLARLKGILREVILAQHQCPPFKVLNSQKGGGFITKEKKFIYPLHTLLQNNSIEHTEVIGHLYGNFFFPFLIFG